MNTPHHIKMQGRELHLASTRGLSLVELMIAVVLGLFVILALTSSFIGQRQTMLITQSLGARADGLRTAAEILARAVREHGYDPCFTSDRGGSSTLSVEPPQSQYSAEPDEAKWLRTFHYEAVTKPTPPTVSVSSISGNIITFAGPHGLVPGDRISICTTSPSVRSLSAKTTVQSVIGPTVTVTQLESGFSGVNPASIQVAKRIDELWHIQANGRNDCGKATCHSLYNGTTEIVPDIDYLIATPLTTTSPQMRITLITRMVSSKQADRQIIVDAAMRNAGGI